MLIWTTYMTTHTANANLTEVKNKNQKSYSKFLLEVRSPVHALPSATPGKNCIKDQDCIFYYEVRKFLSQSESAHGT